MGRSCVLQLENGCQKRGLAWVAIKRAGQCERAGSVLRDNTLAIRFREYGKDPRKCSPGLLRPITLEPARKHGSGQEQRTQAYGRPHGPTREKQGPARLRGRHSYYGTVTEMVPRVTVAPPDWAWTMI